MIKGEISANPDRINMKEFLRIFEVNRFGSKICQKLINEFRDMNEEFATKEN